MALELLWRVKKPLRTIQSHFPSLKEHKDDFYRTYRRVFRVPSESFFAALSLFGGLDGSYIDVGGNTGQSIESIRLYVPKASIVSFEPNPSLAAALVARYKNDPLVTIRDVGLSDKQATMRLHVPAYRGFVYDGLASLDLENARSWLCSDTIYGFNPKHLTVKSYDCAIETLDMQKLDDPIFIKIDTEGTEYSVLKGGIETLEKHEPILLIEGFQDKPEVKVLMAELGYEPYRFENHALVAGASPTSTFLITEWRLSSIKDISIRRIS